MEDSVNLGYILKARPVVEETTIIMFNYRKYLIWKYTIPLYVVRIWYLLDFMLVFELSIEYLFYCEDIKILKYNPVTMPFLGLTNSAFKPFNAIIT